MQNPWGTNFKTKIFKFRWFLGPSDQNELYHTPLLSKIWDLGDRKFIFDPLTLLQSFTPWQHFNLSLPDSEVHEKDAKVSGWGISALGQIDKFYPCKLKEATLKVKILRSETKKLKPRWKSLWAKDVRRLRRRSCAFTTKWVKVDVTDIYVIYYMTESKLCLHHQNLHPPAATCWGDSGGPLTIDEGGFGGCGGYNSIGYFWTQEQLTMMIEPNMLKVFVLSLELSAMDYSVPKNTKCNKNLCFFIMRKT